VEFGKLYLCPVIKLSFGYRPSTAFASVKQTITVYHMVFNCIVVLLIYNCNCIVQRLFTI